jgi:hypothetical protein
MPAPEHPKVFISYSHDSQEHGDRVLTLSDRLRGDGIDCRIDQYEVSPPEGWPRWMVNQIEDADFVLVVCTENYERRFRGKEESGKGLGAQWEGAIITQELYDAEAHNTMFIPVLFSPDHSAYIPIVLRGVTHYNLNTEIPKEATKPCIAASPINLSFRNQSLARYGRCHHWHANNPPMNSHPLIAEQERHKKMLNVHRMGRVIPPLHVHQYQPHSHTGPADLPANPSSPR